MVLLIFVGAAWLLYERLQKYTFHQIVAAVRGIPLRHITLATMLMVLNYLILVGYDWFAVRWVGEKQLPLRRIALASFTGYAFSYNFGATLFGTSIRYRLYSAWGVPLIKILELLVILGLTFWFGVFTLAGLVFMVAPFELPAYLQIPGRPQDRLEMPFQHTFWVGVVLLLVAAAYVVLSAVRRKPFRFLRWNVPIPPLKLTLYQIALACGDLLVAAGVLYAVLPPVEGGYFRVLGVFMLAFVVAILSHVPGGYGVFDGLVFHFLATEQGNLVPQVHGAQVLAALIVFRVIYYWVPLVFAAALLGGNELTMRNSNGEEASTAAEPITVSDGPPSQSG